MTAEAKPIVATRPSYPEPGTGCQARTEFASGYYADRHCAAVARTLQWADESAEHGDHLDAIAWLSTLEAIGDKLPEVYEIRRDSWSAELARTRAIAETRRGNQAT
jgi:hypothetical protein